ncbi:hypothetical protein ABR36_13285 [Enterobacter ludwigii]|nr:hypothetical protein ABR36_13285 [Enterobacter ludwigii]
MTAACRHLRPAAWLLLLSVPVTVTGAGVRPTTAVAPAPDAFTPVAVEYPPVPIAGTEWEKTVRKREAERRRAAKAAPRDAGAVTRRRAGRQH